MTAPCPAKRVVVLGGDGDLAMRYLAPAFTALLRDGRLGAGSTFVGVARTELDTTSYREQVRRALGDAGAPVAFAEHFEYARGDATSAADLRPLVAGDVPAVLYLALPPRVAAVAIAAVADAGVAPSTVVAMEKPFASDTRSARALNGLIRARFQPSQVLRVDHFVAMRAVRDLLPLRFANPFIDRALEVASVVEITWDESLARRDESMFVGGDEVEAQWAIVEPGLEAFRANRVPLLEYPAGSGGPK